MQDRVQDLRRLVVGNVRKELAFRGSQRKGTKIVFNNFDVIGQTKPFAQTPDERGIFLDRDYVLRGVGERRGDNPVSGSDLVNRIGWCDRTHLDEPLDELRTPQEVLRQSYLIVLPCFHVSPPEHAFCAVGLSFGGL
jgi:hypothetical protein